MEKVKEDLIVKIEDYLNRRNAKHYEPSIVFENYTKEVISNFDNGSQRKIDEYLNGIEKKQTQVDFVCGKIEKEGFTYDDGQPNFVKFYTYARINPDVWHTFITQKHKPSEDTMFKIVFALKLSESEAEHFLNLGGYAFNHSNELHKYVLACINTMIYDPDEVYEVLEFYHVHNIYAEKKARADCK